MNRDHKIILFVWVIVTILLGGAHLLLVNSDFGYWLFYNAGVFDEEYGILDGLPVRVAILVGIFAVPLLPALIYLTGTIMLAVGEILFGLGVKVENDGKDNA